MALPEARRTGRADAYAFMSGVIVLGLSERRSRHDHTPSRSLLLLDFTVALFRFLHDAPALGDFLLAITDELVALTDQ